MLRQIKASRLKIFALATALCGIAFPIASALLWEQWLLETLARNLGIHPDPISLGIIASLIPLYFIAIELWLPIRLPPPKDKTPARPPATEAQKHWNAVRLVALMCIVLTELVVQVVPEHSSSTTNTMRLR